MAALEQVFHLLLTTWFNFVQQWGYIGVFLLMALESSIFPIPSEVILPPAAFWASQGKMSFWGVVAAGTFGSYFGSIVSYWVSRVLGKVLIERYLNRYGKYVFLDHQKIELAKKWVYQFGVVGIFVARLLPVVRHLVSIPAGVFRMKVPQFSAATLLGAFSWCLVLSWFGHQAIGSNPELLASPEALVAVCKQKLHWFIGGVVVFSLLYGLVLRFKQHHARSLTI